MLPVDDFQTVVRCTPLVSIDLIAEDWAGNFLLGERVNAPARGSWFVPGGRVFKGETMDQAFARIAKEEIGLPFSHQGREFLGVFQHLYPDNTFSLPGFGTHYLVLGFHLYLDKSAIHLPTDQHARYQWFSREDLLQNPHVHSYTKDYFRGAEHIRESGATPLHAGWEPTTLFIPGGTP